MAVKPEFNAGIITIPNDLAVIVIGSNKPSCADPTNAKKSNPITFNMSDNYINYISDKLDIIENKDKAQPEQRTQEWFEQRHNLLSASTIWKSIDKQNYKNALIFEKCEPIDPERYNRVSINTPFHHGQKFPLTCRAFHREQKLACRRWCAQNRLHRDRI